MIIGTPLSKNATRVMLLGSGELGKEVIISLQRFGVEVIAVDRYENAPGHQVAHRAHVINMADAKALREVIELEKPHIIVPEIEAIATDELVRIEFEGLAEVIPTARATQLTMNREGIRRLAADELGLLTSKFQFADCSEDFKQAVAEVEIPCIVKPVMSSSGKGQSSINSEQDIQTAWDYAMSGGRVSQDRVIIEQKIDFDYEITLLTVRAKNSQGKIETSYCEPIGHIQEHGDYVESWQPQPMNKITLQKAKDIALQITDALGGRGIFGVELFIKNDQVWFSEVSPRPHDTGMVTMATQAQNEFELHARAILGLPVSTKLRSAGASAVIYGDLEAIGISFENLDQALTIPNSDIRLFGKPESFTRRRMGVALSYADDIATARKHSKQAAALIKTSVS
ncbi:Phosphoribosylglycinamide formyltransferase 2 [hydrothermal vent metagenome]|uniref:Phosphoribosylglycinamide formyltransferase 2 n=1 Tax=hydrothermal vent metagenome TaxID=652676 RepID=A0A3B1AD81_9ZZZZ